MARNYIYLKKYPIAFAVVSPACVVIYGLPIGLIGRKFRRLAKVRIRAEPIRFRWHDGGEIATKPRLNLIGTAKFRYSNY